MPTLYHVGEYCYGYKFIAPNWSRKNHYGYEKIANLENIVEMVRILTYPIHMEKVTVVRSSMFPIHMKNIIMFPKILLCWKIV